ncbi:hypothetical protein NC653_014116 [Populus alba x Populus x berolinensis]|uniref:Uncharacterized protein n=2 Tax=Populus alba x Populus x berolinensis TaxID=444605 RepID=A0AAD6QW45_9ROSI|nr:hypothetical protein NC653_014116 [Populus alba x Populus x berolinensis]
MNLDRKGEQSDYGLGPNVQSPYGPDPINFDYISIHQALSCLKLLLACVDGMEVSSFSPSSPSPSLWDYLGLLILRPALAILFVTSFISIGWFLAWKLVLVHVPLVQEIFGLRKKLTKPKPRTGRISRIYNTIDARNSTPAG